MRNLKEKKSFRSFFHSKPALFLLGLLVLFFAWNIFGLVMKMEDTRKNKEVAEAKLLELERSQKALSMDIENLKTEKGVEKNIREKFGYVKEGEGLIVVVNDKNAPPSPEDSKHK